MSQKELEQLMSAIRTVDMAQVAESSRSLCPTHGMRNRV
jgi:hypothetical protein